MLDIRLLFKYGKKLARFIRNKKYFWFLTKLFIIIFLIKLKKFYWQFSIKGIKMDDLMQSVFCPNSPIAKLEKLQWSPALLSTLCKFALHSPVVYFQILNVSLSHFALDRGFWEVFFSEKWSLSSLDFLSNEDQQYFIWKLRCSAIFWHPDQCF